MSRIKQFNLPDLGEGLTEGEILHWLVKPGEQITLNQPIVEVETAKAAVEIPSPYAGVVAELFHGEGDTVDVGAPIISVDTDPSAGPLPEPAPGGATTEPASGSRSGPGVTPASGGPTPEAERAADTATPSEESLAQVRKVGEDEAIEPGLIGGPAPGGRTSVLVGYGPKSVTAKRRPRKPAPAASGEPLSDPDLSLLPTIPDQLPDAVKPVRHGGLEVGRAAERAAEAASAPVLAKPPVRKLARDLGVDLAVVRGTGASGTITRDDVQRAAQHVGAAREEEYAVPLRPAPTAPAWDASREQRIPIKGVRKLTAEATATSAFTAPHVTEFLTVDVTRMTEAVARLKSAAGFEGVRVSPLLLVARAMLLAVKRHPMINSSWDGDAGEIVVKEYVNLGIAAATPRGLTVPNLKDAGRLSTRELADALTSLVQTAKDGKTSPADMRGGTITITNVGVFGVDTGTPILNPGEAAILCFGAVRPMPWVVEGQVVPRQVTTLGLSFDHRIVDGELGSNFLADIGRFLSDPETYLLAWG
jgi:pyruvate dehydrogenase E2 component (dihydrolipoamide acetyltransferase)